MFPMQLSLYHVSTVQRGNVLLKCLDIVYRLNREQVNANDRAFDGHLLGCHLTPTKSPSEPSILPSSRSCTEINQHMSFGQKVELPIQLDKLKSRTSSVALLLGKGIPLISCSLCLFGHRYRNMGLKQVFLKSLWNRGFANSVIMSTNEACASLPPITNPIPTQNTRNYPFFSEFGSTKTVQ